MDLLQLGAQLLSEKLGLQADTDTITGALSSLLGDGQGNIDFGALASRMAASGELSGILDSWLGDGANAGISADSVLGMLGQSNVSEFASTVGTDTGSAAQGLSEVLPRLMDDASSGGELLSSAGGLGGLMGAAKSLLS